MNAEVAALLISALSLVLAGLSLGWQIAQWLLSAGRPKAKLVHGILNSSEVYSGPVTKKGRPFDLEKFRNQGIDGIAVVGIQITNHGRAPVIIETVTLLPRGGVMRWISVGNLVGPELPHRLKPGTNESWFVPMETAVRLVHSSREALNEEVSGVYMAVQLGTGKAINTSETLQV